MFEILWTVRRRYVIKYTCRSHRAVSLIFSNQMPICHVDYEVSLQMNHRYARFSAPTFSTTHNTRVSEMGAEKIRKYLVQVGTWNGKFYWVRVNSRSLVTRWGRHYVDDLNGVKCGENDAISDFYKYVGYLETSLVFGIKMMGALRVFHKRIIENLKIISFWKR